ncbi:capsular polysaccharide export protein, LipB/KpsS family [Actibacterium sp. D379-3]
MTVPHPRRRILLFHRMDLALLFSGLAAPLSRDLDVFHMAYGAEEKDRLASLGVSDPVVVFKDEIRALHDQIELSPALLEEIDALIIEQTDGAFSLNSAIQSDRGFALLDYADALHLTATYYVFWTRFIEDEGIDFLLHEPCTLMFNFLPALILAKRGGAYLYNIMATGRTGTLNHLTMTGYDFTCPEITRNLAEIEAGTRAVDPVACDAFLTEFRTSYEVFLSGVLGSKPSPMRLVGSMAKHAVVNRRKRARHDRVLDNIDHWRFSQNLGLDKLRNLVAYRRIAFDTIDPSERFFFYPLHLEPEAVVLYHAHGIYENQVKLIQNIAGQLPPGTWLYVKDHPHDIGYRNAADYAKLKSVPNIRLIDARISGREVIRHAAGVITLTGTAGFEALLLGKQVYTFGKTFYSPGPRVTYLRHMRYLRAALYARRKEDALPDDDLYPYLTAYLDALHPGLTDYFAGRAEKYGIDLDENAERVAINLLATVADLGPGKGRACAG